MSDFARAKALFAAISAIVTQNLGQLETQTQLNKLAPYRSRGKGRGTPPRNFGNNCYNTPHQGARECARRVRQMANGTHGL